MEVIIAPKARSDIASILAWTEENFGPQTLKRYAKLIATAIEQIAENPERAGSSQRPEIAEHCRTYHLDHVSMSRHECAEIRLHARRHQIRDGNRRAIRIDCVGTCKRGRKRQNKQTQAQIRKGSASSGRTCLCREVKTHDCPICSDRETRSRRA